MTLWTELARVSTEAGDDIILRRRGDIHEIRFNGIELMSNLTWRSEAVLAERSLRRHGGDAPRVLIGGLGMGFTLRAALADLPKTAQITVAELVPEVISWAEGPLAHLYGDSLSDRRLTVRRIDVAELIAEGAAQPYDAILMDTDNGPDGLNRNANDSLYSASGVAALRRAVKHGGVCAVWSAAPDPAFAGRLRRGGFAVEEVKVRASPSGKGARHIIWLGVAR